jgi:hypothetical protein
MTMFQEKRRIQQEQLITEHIILSNCLWFFNNTKYVKVNYNFSELGAKSFTVTHSAILLWILYFSIYLIILTYSKNKIVRSTYYNRYISPYRISILLLVSRNIPKYR